MRLDKVPQQGLKAILHALQTLPGTLRTIVSIVAAALVGLIAQEIGAPPAVCVVVAITAFFLSAVLLSIWGFQSITGFWKDLSPRFTPPPR